MDTGADFASERKLRRIPVGVRFAGAVLAVAVLFPIGIESDHVYWFAAWLLAANCGWLVVLRLSVADFIFRGILFLWVVGTLVYLPFAVIWAFSGLSVSPWIELEGLRRRGVFLMYRPMIVLGALSVGIVLVRNTDAFEFASTRLLGVGLQIAVLIRVFQLSLDEIVRVREEMMARGLWPVSRGEMISASEVVQKIRQGRKLLIVTARNVFSELPWVWIAFESRVAHQKRLEVSDAWRI